MGLDNKHKFTNRLLAVGGTLPRALIPFLLGATALTPPAMANPLDGSVVGGSAAISSPNAKTVQIDQTSDKAVIDWRGFSISADELTKFNQPGADSITLNRVTGGTRSDIDGALKANGQVWLINPQGIAFGATSQVDVSGLVASTADITNENFMAGTYDFSIPGNADAAVTNAGTITIGDAGLGALVAPWVRNDGVITAKFGTIALASGETFTLDFSGDGLIQLELSGNAKELAQTGLISANGGRVLLTAADATSALGNVINMTGTVEATSVASVNGEIVLGGGNGSVSVAGTLGASGTDAGETGGNITVTGKDITLTSTANLDASGDQGGGNIKVGGAFQGKGATPTAENTTVETGATLKANAITQGDGGEIIVWADDTTEFDGTASVRGGAIGGDGGFVETSGKQHLRVGSNAFVDALAGHGAVGSWLLDPSDITIDAALAGTIVTGLAGANIIVATDPAAAGNGDIFVHSALDYTSGNDLTLLANRNIEVNANIQNAGDGTVNLIAGWDDAVLSAAASGIDDPSTFDVSTFIAAPGSYGSGGDVIIGDGAQTSGIAVGSRFGTTTVLAEDLTVTGSAAFSDAYAQLGFQASSQGAAYAITGAIDVHTTGNITAQGGGADSAYAQIGHVGGDLSGAATAEADVDAAITVNAGGTLTLTGGDDAFAYAQLGHGGTDVFSDHSGDISVDTGGDLTLTGGSDVFAYAQLGHGGDFAFGDHSGAIDVDAGGDLALTGGSGDDTYAQLGHGGYFSFGDHSGAIDVDAAGALTLTGGSGDDTYAQLGHGDAADDASGTRTGNIDVRAGGLTTLTQGTGGSYRIGHGTTRAAGISGANVALVTNGLSVTDGDFVGMLANALEGGATLIANLLAADDGSSADDITLSGTAQTFTSANTLSLAAGGEVYVNTRFQNAGTGDIELVAGWDGTTGLDLTGFPAFDVDVVEAADAFGVSFGDIEIGDGNQTAAIAIGSAQGRTVALSHDLQVYGSDTTADAYAQLGFVTSAQAATGDIYVVGLDDVEVTAGDADNAYAQIGHGGSGATNDAAGTIDIYAEEDLLVDGFAGVGSYGQIGHGGHSFTGDGSGAIAIDAGYAAITGGDDDEAYAQIGHGGWESIGDFSGNILLESFTDVEVVGGVGEDAYAQVGHGGTASLGAKSGNITVEADDLIGVGSQIADGIDAYAQIGHGGAYSASLTPITGDISITSVGAVFASAGGAVGDYAQIGHGGLESQNDVTGTIDVDSGFIGVGSGTANKAYGQIGHGGLDSVGTLDGDVDVHAASLEMFGGDSNNTYSQIGHGGGRSDGARSGRVRVEVDNYAAIIGGDDSNAYAQLGHGGRGSIGDNSGRVTLLAGDTIDIQGGAGEHAYAQVGHGGRGSQGNNSNRIRVDAARAIRVDGGHEQGAYAQIGHGGRNQTGDNSGRIEVDSNRSVRVRGGDAGSTYAMIGHGGRGQEGDNSNRIDVTANRDVTVLAGDANNAFAQIGHGGRETLGEQAGRVTVDAGRDVEVFGGDGNNAYAQIGHGGYLSDGIKRRDISVTAGRDLFVYDGYRENAYAQIGHGGHTSLGDASGDVTVSAGGLVDVEAGESDLGYALIGHGGLSSRGGVSGNISVATADVEVDFSSSASAWNFAQIGHGGAASFGTRSGAISVAATGDITVAGGNGAGNYAQIGHGGNGGSGDLSGDIDVNAGGALSVTGGGIYQAYAQIGHGGLLAIGAIDGMIRTVVGGALNLIGGSDTASYAQIGHGDFTKASSGTRSGDVTITSGGLATFEENTGGFWLGHQTSTADGLVNADLTLTTNGLSVTGNGFVESLANALGGSVVTVTNTATKGTANDGITLTQDLNGPGRGSLIMIANGDVTTQGLSGAEIINLISGGTLNIGQVTDVVALQAGAGERLIRNGDIGSAGSPLSSVVLIASEIAGGPFTIYADAATLAGTVGNRAAGTISEAVLIDVGALTLAGPSALVAGDIGGVTAQPGADFGVLANPTGRVGTVGIPTTSDYILIDPTTDRLYVIAGASGDGGSAAGASGDGGSAAGGASTITSSEPQNAGLAGLGGAGFFVGLGDIPLVTAAVREVEGEGVSVPLGPGACGQTDQLVAAIAGIFFNDVSGSCQ